MNSRNSLQLCIKHYRWRGVRVGGGMSEIVEKVEEKCKCPYRNFRERIQRLWVDHITYTGRYIVAALGSQPEAGAVLQRLLRNQDELGAALGGGELPKLLRDHIVIAGAIVAAVAKGDNATVAKQSKAWEANARAIANVPILGAMLPDFERMMLLHLKMTTEEVLAQARGDWEASVASFDANMNHALVMANYIASRMPPESRATSLRF